MEEDTKTLVKRLTFIPNENNGTITWYLDSKFNGVDKIGGTTKGGLNNSVLCVAMQLIVEWATISYHSKRDPEFTTLKVYCPEINNRFVNLCRSYAGGHVFPFILILCDEKTGHCQLINRAQE